MQHNLISKAFASFLLLSSTNAMQAQQSWAIATIEEGNNWPSFTVFRCMSEKGVNGMDYYRIYDECCRIRQEYYNPVKLQYGYRISDEQIYVYDFETNEERLAFDFSLSEGDHFITYNGLEWEIETVIDTIVNTSYKGQGESCMKRLLKVHSVDGRYSDHWLEGFGSFTNHFMILPMSEVRQTQTLWMEYDEGHYLVREISSDPFFAHDSGMPKETTDYVGKTEYVNSTYKDGILTVEDERWRSPNREYNCFYRVGDDFYLVYVWKLNPATDAAIAAWHKDIAYYYGLPAPHSDRYTIHFNLDDRPLGESTKLYDLTNDTDIYPSESSIFNLQGHRLTGKPLHGLYIKNGKKVQAK